jgi:hypothetical protein
MAPISPNILTVEHIDPRDHSLICGLENELNEVIADASYNYSKCNRFVPYRVGLCDAPVHPGDFGEFLIEGEWVICLFAVKDGIWWRESLRIGFGGSNRRGTTSTEEVKKKQSESMKNMLWWNNGNENMRSRTCPGEGWVRGRILSEISRAAITESLSISCVRAMFWNNGETCIRSAEYPGEGWVRGRLPYTRARVKQP